MIQMNAAQFMFHSPQLMEKWHNETTTWLLHQRNLRLHEAQRTLQETQRAHGHARREFYATPTVHSWDHIFNRELLSDAVPQVLTLRPIVVPRPHVSILRHWNRLSLSMMDEPIAVPTAEPVQFVPAVTQLQHAEDDFFAETALRRHWGD